MKSLLYYITDRGQFAGDEKARRAALLAKIEEAVRCGVDYVQLREKDLSTRELEMLARDVVGIVQRTGAATGEQTGTRLLINSRTDVALAAGADGVHLRSDDVTVGDVRSIWNEVHGGNGAAPVVAVSCHSSADVVRSASDGADLAVFGPVFGKRDVAATGVDALRDACRAGIPVFALGGVTLENMAMCLEVGAKGIAGIRLFQENCIADVVQAAGR